ncbi:distal membrane-arm assembly complex protein 2-like [Argonauta hians]
MAVFQKRRVPSLLVPLLRVPSRSSSYLKNLLKFFQTEYSFDSLKEKANQRLFDVEREDQVYRPERHRILGPDLASAHFLLARGASIKFVDNDMWHRAIQKKVLLPRKRIDGLYLEGIDASNTRLLYEGFDNLVNLSRLRYLSLKNCQLIDDWCLDRLHIFRDSLEFLDLSGCHNISERGIVCLHKLPKLQSLILKDLPNIKHLELVAILLQDVSPNCRILTSPVEEDDIPSESRLSS